VTRANEQQKRDIGNPNYELRSENEDLADFIYGADPGNTPQQEFLQKFGSKKRTRTMPASFFNFG